MKIEAVRLGLIQDSDIYLQVARLDFARAAQLEIAPSLDEGLDLLERLAADKIILDLLGLDENLTADDHSGTDGRVLYKRIKVLELDKKVRLVNISTTPTLPVAWVGGFTPKELMQFVESM